MNAATVASIPVKVLKALADETRMRILRHLARGECCVCDLTARLELAQPLLSFHLRILKEAGLVVDRREGRWAYYALDAGALRGVGESLAALAEPGSPRRRGRRCN